jgi:hypothetical protein
LYTFLFQVSHQHAIRTLATLNALAANVAELGDDVVCTKKGEHLKCESVTSRSHANNQPLPDLFPVSPAEGRRDQNINGNLSCPVCRRGQQKAKNHPSHLKI